jgi:TetR/AcrR family transcriptional regulator, regulator of biofilm formation and stress response
MSTGPRRHDPGRHDRIIDATLDLIASRGVAAATYRTIAEAADVPLGSMTYHFASRDDLLFAAFQRFVEDSLSPFAAAMSDGSEKDPRERLVQIVITEDGHRNRLLLAELYVLAYRDERYADLTKQWMRQARAAIAPHTDAAIANVLDAVQEGLTLHRWFLPDEITEQVVRRTITTLMPPFGTR